MSTRNRIYQIIGVVAITLAYGAGAATGEVLSVPGEYATIQAAIDAAAAGDVVEIADGTYTGAGNKDLDFGGKAITVRSASGDPAACIIDCEDEGRGFYFHSGEGTDSIVEGLTVTHGYSSDNGGGLLILQSSPTITFCVFDDNDARTAGGGVRCGNNCAPAFTNCSFTNNDAYRGGGLSFQMAANATFGDCLISNNTTLGNGGGVHCRVDCEARFENCTISHNLVLGEVNNHGGGIFCTENCTVSLIDCTIVNNTINDEGSSGYGGGVYGHESDLIISGCTISGNRATNCSGVVCGRNSMITECRFSGNYVGCSLGCSSDSATISDCVISDNLGSGLSCSNGSPTITNCIISDNEGLGVKCSYAGNPILVDCTISGNRGGVYCDDSSPTLIGCSILNNMIRGDGGGINCFESDPAIIDCIIAGNTAINGGGIWSRDGAPIIRNCTISANSSQHGGGIAARGLDEISLVNCAIYGNSAAENGGGLDSSEFSCPTLTNCTLNGNTAGIEGGGVCCEVDSCPILTNCILWSDSPQEVYADSSGLIVAYCDVQGGWPGEGNIDATPFALDGDMHLAADSPCIDAGLNETPVALPEIDLDGNTRVLDGDGDEDTVVDMGAYEFNPAAPSISVSPMVVEFDVVYDSSNPPPVTLSLRNCGGVTLEWQITGQPEWLSIEPPSGESAGEIDDVTISAFTAGMPSGMHTATLTVVDPQAVNSPREATVVLKIAGVLSVPRVYPTIQDAIDAAFEGGVVEIADGTYTGAGNKNLDFGGKAITVRSASGDPAACVIDCEHDGRGITFRNGEGAGSIVEGLTITNGYAYEGGGVDCKYSSPTLTNCVLHGNVAIRSGGGMRCERYSNPILNNCTVSDNRATFGGGLYGYQSEPTLIGCTIGGNLAETVGGGAYCYGDGIALLIECLINDNASGQGGGGVLLYSPSILIDCQISENAAAGDGGGIYCCGSHTTFMNCTIEGNAGSRGGGVSIASRSPVFTNCRISGNTAINAGGGVFGIGDGSPYFVNCSICRNSSDYGGGGVGCFIYNEPELVNCILWGNEPQEILAASLNPLLTYCNVQNGVGEAWFGEGCIDADPGFVDPDGPDDDPATWEDNDYRLAPGSPCIDAGDNWAVPADEFDLDDDGDVDEPTPVDLDWKARFVDDLNVADTGAGEAPIVDMGAYEYTPADLDNDGDVDLGDLATMLGRYGSCTGDAAYHVLADLDSSGCIDLSDLAGLLGYYGFGS